MALFAAGTLGNIVRVVWSSIVASLIVSVLFSSAVVGLIRASELRRAGRASIAAAYGAAALMALLICLAAVVYGIILVGHRG